MITEIISPLLFILGLAVGSFLNCLIYRLEIDSKPTGRSFCPSCKHKLSWKDLIPLFSYLSLKGRCRYCGKKISFQYPLVELATGVLFFLVGMSIGSLSGLNYLNLALSLIVFSLLVVIFVYDLKHFIIPNKVIYPAIFVTLALLVSRSFLTSDYSLILNNIITGAIVFLSFLAIYLLSRGKGIGFGDVRYAFFMGLFLGFPEVLVGLFLSFVIGAIIGVTFIILGRKGRKDMIPFGPFLVFGTVTAHLYGSELINLYLDLILI